MAEEPLDPMNWEKRHAMATKERRDYLKSRSLVLILGHLVDAQLYHEHPEQIRAELHRKVMRSSRAFRRLRMAEPQVAPVYAVTVAETPAASATFIAWELINSELQRRFDNAVRKLQER